MPAHRNAPVPKTACACSSANGAPAGYGSLQLTFLVYPLAALSGARKALCADSRRLLILSADS